MINKLVVEFEYNIDNLIRSLYNEKYFFLLDSNRNHDVQSKYTYLGINPVDYLIIDDIDNINKYETLTKLNEFYSKYRKDTIEGIDESTFNTGFLSFISYDLGLIFEDIKRKSNGEQHKLPLAFIGYYPVIIKIAEKSKEKSIITINYDDEYHKRALDLVEKIKKIQIEISESKDKVNNFQLTYQEEFSDYKEKISIIKNYIYEGDIYQVNYTRQFKGYMEGLNVAELYINLRKKNPAPFASFIHGNNWSILSTSPERLIKNINNKLITRPIKGTIAVADDYQQNEQNKKILLNSIKDKSELLMIVDLERNDLSKIAVPGSVKVEELYKLETYETVHHLVSTISCILDKDYSPLDVIYNIFPGGSITGTPKKRAMEIIEELEEYDRGIYTGSIGYIDHNGNFDFNIAIRTVVVEDQEVKFNVGGGITWKSTAEEEFKETEVKGLGIMKGLGIEYNS